MCVAGRPEKLTRKHKEIITMTPQSNNARNAERMKQHQSLRVPILTHPPFLQEPASFGSPRTRSQLDQSQAGQIIAIPAPRRSPPVMELGEVIGAQSVDEISQSG